MISDKSKILIILPAFNEGKVIGEVLSNLRANGYSSICVVDDGSRDNTSVQAKKAGATVLKHPINRGAGAAAQTGVAFAKKHGFEYAVLMDSDGQHLPKDIQSLYIKLITSEADIVIGNRFASHKNEVPQHRIVFNQIANVFTNVFCKKNYRDTQSGFRILNRKAIEHLKLKTRGFGFCSEMIIFSEKNKLHIEETPIGVLYTNYSLNKGQNLLEGIRTAQSILWRVMFD